MRPQLFRPVRAIVYAARDRKKNKFTIIRPAVVTIVRACRSSVVLIVFLNTNKARDDDHVL